MIDREQLLAIREWGLGQHSDWKRRIQVGDLMVQRKWATLWPDLTSTVTDPLVENLYAEALYDKAATAAAVTPFVEVAPVRGTPEDRAERSAQLRRRAFVSLMRDSDIEDKQIDFAFDWLQTGAMYQMPWTDWNSELQRMFPYLVRFDPRFAYPFAHNSRDELTGVYMLKYRRIVDIEHDYSMGTGAEAIAKLKLWVDQRRRKQTDSIEEIWYADSTHWGVAIVATADLTPPHFRYIAPTYRTSGAPFAEWVVPPHPHKLEGCPVIEKRRKSPDGEYHGALEDMVPQLKVAHNLMARILDDVEMQIGAPIVVDNIENPEDIGPGAYLFGSGDGTPVFESARAPTNFEGMQHVAHQLSQARGAGAFPPQRSGDFDASIASAKATSSVMGSFNTQLAWNQRDLAMFYRRGLSRCANFDEMWCGGDRKEIQGWDEGEQFTDKYDPAVFWKKDYRLDIGFQRVGLDEQQWLTRLAMARNAGGIAQRTFIRKSGLVENPLAEEREMAIEATVQGFLALMQQQAASGNDEPLTVFTRFIDEDKDSVRSAVFKTIQATKTKDAEAAAAAPGGPGGDAIAQMRSLESGGIPGQAEQLPTLGPEVAQMLSPQMRRQAAEIAPGASGP